MASRQESSNAPLSKRKSTSSEHAIVQTEALNGQVGRVSLNNHSFLCRRCIAQMRNSHHTSILSQQILGIAFLAASLRGQA